MKLRVNPMVFAAALGLLGPAALEDEDGDRGPIGLWQRDPDAPDAEGASSLGERIEVLALEDRFFIDDGQGAGLTDQGSWSRLSDGSLRQELVLDSARVLREFKAEADSLAVHTQVERDGDRVASVSYYSRRSG